MSHKAGDTCWVPDEDAFYLLKERYDGKSVPYWWAYNIKTGVLHILKERYLFHLNPDSPQTRLEAILKFKI